MLIRYLPFFAILIFIGFTATASAHTSEIILGYKVEIGWVEEPPTVNSKNAIEIFVSEATESDFLMEKNKKFTVSPADSAPHDHSSHDHGGDQQSSETESEFSDSAPHDHSSHDHGDELIPRKDSVLEGTEQAVYEQILKWKHTQISPNEAIKRIHLILQANQNDIYRSESLQKIESLKDDVVVWHRSVFETLSSMEKILDQRINEIENSRMDTPDEIPDDFTNSTNPDQTNEELIDTSLLLEETEQSILQLIKQWEDNEISEYKAIREIQLILHNNKDETQFNPNLQAIESMTRDAITGESSYQNGMVSINEAIEGQITYLKNSIHEPPSIVIEEPVMISGLADKLEVSVKIKNTKTFLVLNEDSDLPGRYVGKFTPLENGTPFVSVYLGTFGDKEIALLFHPEEVMKSDLS